MNTASGAGVHGGMVTTHDASGPRLLTVSRSRAFVAHYLAAAGFPGHEFRIREQPGSVTIEVAGVSDDAKVAVARSLRNHVCVGVELTVIDG